MLLRGIEFDPAKNPGTLNTLTWDLDAAAKLVSKDNKDAKAIHDTLTAGLATDKPVEDIKKQLQMLDVQTVKPIAPSLVVKDGKASLLLALQDGQRVFWTVSGTKEDNWAVYIKPVDLEFAASYIKSELSQFTPKALGPVSRLGIGNRHTTFVWPGIFAAISEIGGPAELIQNSAYRELAPMDFILAPPSKESAYLPGHGSLNIGHTGTSIEGLWLHGVVSAIEHGFTEPYGADLDHVPVKGLDEQSIQHAKKLIECGRHYTFFTLDTSYLFNLEGKTYEERFGKAIEAGVLMYEYIKSLKGEEPFDFEFSLDEAPAITAPEEQEYVLKAFADRGVKVDFIAPNVGFEKRVDYRLPDGLQALEERVRALSEIAGRYGALLDFHSGSDKSSETYRTIAKACGGNLKLKVSGKLQLILGEVLADVDPQFFNEWYDWTLETARAEAMNGSDVAKKYLDIVEQRMQKEGTSFKRSPKDLFFTDFSFAMVGAKDEQGRFLFRDRFYSLSPEVHAEYTRRVKDYVVGLAEDLGLRRK